MAINYFNRLEPAQEVQRQCQEKGVQAVVIKAVRYYFFLLSLGLRLWGWGDRLREIVMVWMDKADELQDMTNTDEARRAVRETIEQLGGIDIVLANAVRTCPLPILRKTMMLMWRTGLDQVLRLEGSRGDERGRVG